MTSSLPLTGVRVVDFSRLLPGPWATQVLGDLGADIIKVEQPEVGDYGRFNPPHYKHSGVYFSSINRNKKSIVLNLGQEPDRLVAKKLVEDADIVVEAFRPGVLKKFGLDYATVSKKHPSVIYCSINGFGSDGPLSRQPGHDLSLQGLAGFMEIKSDSARLPSVPTFQAGDYAAAAYAAIGILAAHIRRLQTGKGCNLDVPIYDSLISLGGCTLSSALARLAGSSGEPGLGSFGTNPRYATYRTRDGKFVTVSLLETRSWHLFCNHIGRPDLIYDEGWADRHSTHGQYEHKFRDAITEFCARYDRDDLAQKMHEANIPICAVYNADEALNSAEAKARGVIAYRDNGGDGKVPYFRDPLQRAGLTDPSRLPAPTLGQHTDAIKSELGMGREA